MTPQGRGDAARAETHRAPPGDAIGPEPRAPGWTPLLVTVALAALAQAYLVWRDARSPAPAPAAPAAFRPTGVGTATPPSALPDTVAAAPVAPVALVNVVALDFGRRPVGTTAVRIVRVVNLGPGPLRVRGVALAGVARADFAVRGACLHRAVAPDAGCMLAVGFAPRARGVRRARLVIADDTAGGSHVVALEGRGR